MRLQQLKMEFWLCPRCTHMMHFGKLGELGHHNPYIIVECDNCGLVDGAGGANLQSTVKSLHKALAKDRKRFSARARHPKIRLPRKSV